MSLHDGGSAVDRGAHLVEAGCAREMELAEWCARLPHHHAVNRRLRTLEHCRSHPVKWAIWDLLRRLAPFVRWRSPLEKETP